MSPGARLSTAATALVVCVVLGIWAPGPLLTGVGTDTASPLLIPTEPYVLLPLTGIVVIFEALRRDWRAVAFAVLGTAVPVALNSWVAKPLFHHRLHDYLTYPSGHTVNLVATLTVLVLLARQGIARAVAVAAAVLATGIGGTGLVEAGYHYPLDVLGGVCFAVAVTFAVSLGTHPAPGPSTGSPRAGTSSGSPPGASPR